MNGRRRAPRVRLAALLVVLWATSGPGVVEGQNRRSDLVGSLRQLSGSRVTVSHAPEDSARASLFLAFLEGQAPLPGLPDSLPTRVSAYLAPTPESFRLLTGGRAPEWSGGVAIPGRNALVLPAYGGGLSRAGEAWRVLRHEWAHLGLHQYLGNLRIPRWFDEGYAEWAGGWDAGEAWRLRILLASGRAPPLDSLSFRWPSDATSAQAAYLLSATALEYLVSESGERGLELFLARWRDMGSFDGALRVTYGVTSGQLEEDWRRYVRRRYGWAYVASHSMVFWGLLALTLLLMVRIRGRHRRERMARLRADELPEDPAWWAEEGEADGNGGDRRGPGG
ncbi:MAG TPA: hypothetical protein VGA70_01350 [Longimicrobiales bacterium]